LFSIFVEFLLCKKRPSRAALAVKSFIVLNKTMNFKSEFGNHFWNLCRLSAWAQTRPSPHRPKSGHGLVPAAMDLVKALAPN
jgi:hypothetical protein